MLNHEALVYFYSALLKPFLQKQHRDPKHKNLYKYVHKLFIAKTFNDKLPKHPMPLTNASTAE